MNKDSPKLDLVKELRDKQSWFDGKYFIESHYAPPYVPCKNLLGPAADEIEHLRAENKTLTEFAAKASDEKMLLLRELKDA